MKTHSTSTSSELLPAGPPAGENTSGEATAALVKGDDTGKETLEQTRMRWMPLARVIAGGVLLLIILIKWLIDQLTH